MTAELPCSPAMMDGFEYRTPESLSVSQPLAGIGSRGLAAIVDSCIVLIIVALLVAGALVVAVLPISSAPVGAGLVVTVVVASVVPVLYYVVSEVASGGRSIGKALFGLRVVNLQGVPVGVGDSLVRNLIRIVDFLPFGYAIGVVAMFVGRQPRRLGDLAAGTVVIHDMGMRRLARTGGLQGVPVLTSRSDPGTPLAGADRCGKFDLDLLQDFLSRPGLSPARRQVLAASLLTALTARAGPELARAAEGQDRLDFLERLYLQLRQRLSGS